MKNIKLFNVLTFFILLSPSLFCAASFNNNVTANELATQIQGRGITITNPIITRGQIGGGNSQIATFSNGVAGANLQIDEGILLTASTATEAFSTNNSGRMSRNPGNINNVGGLPRNDPDLISSLVNVFNLFNQVVFEFDVTLDANTRLLLVSYQFASDEYPEWVGSRFNDAFGFFISGGDLSQTYNIARVVDDTTIVNTVNIGIYDTVNINNVNIGAVGSQNSGEPVVLTNSAFFINNGGTNAGLGGLDPAAVVIESEFDGFTRRLHATIDNLTPGETYHFKMAIADVADAAWDAGVFVNKIIGVRVPSVCYDYDVRVGDDIPVPSQNNDIVATAYSGEQLNLGIVMQSLEGELPLLDMNMTVLLNPNNNLLLNKVQISPDSINTYLDIPDAWIKKVPYAQIPIGENLTPSGGTISANQTMFTKFIYDINGSNNIDTHFDLTANLKLNLNGIIIDRTIRTGGANPTLTRCPTQAGYNPIWRSLNIERRNSHLGLAAEQHVLYTQISNRPFDIDVVSYDPNNTSLPADIEGITVDLELIDAGKYTESNQSIFTCREPNRVGNGKFVTFSSPPSSRVQVNNFSTPRALQNAAFRLWYLVDVNDSILPHSCIDQNDNACFQTLYNNEIKDIVDTAPYICQTACSSGDCYQCLRDYFARPVCSRDNFAIRPASYSLMIQDDNQSVLPNAPLVTIGDNASNTPLDLAAGYNYILEGNATQYGSDENATGYYAYFKASSTPDYISQFQFNSTKTGCADTNNSNLEIMFRRGQLRFATEDNNTNAQLQAFDQYSNRNVGEYLYHIEDNNWTIVDQQRYPYKTFPNVEDCITISSSLSPDGDSKSGCTISSNVITASKTYQDIPLRFHPFSFNLTDITFSIPTNGDNFIYLNELNTTSITDLYMSATFTGNIVAEASGGTRTSNFTTGCYASPVVFDINRSIFRENNLIDENNISAENLDDNTQVKIHFQRQYLDSQLQPNYQIQNNDTNTSTSFTIAATEFADDQNGSARLRLYYNFNKPLKHVMNPLAVRFNRHQASAPQEISNALMRSDYTAEGTADINRTIDFYYGRVVSSQDVYIIDSEVDNQVVPLYVEAYCNDAIMDCTLHGLALSSVRTAQTWWINTRHNSPRADGLIANFNDPKGATNLTVSPGAPVNLNRDNNRTDVTFTINSTTPRPYRTKIEVRPDVPWLNYNPAELNNLPSFILNYNGGGGWAGKGNTGMKVDTNASYDNIRKRLEW